MQRHARDHHCAAADHQDRDQEDRRTADQADDCLTQKCANIATAIAALGHLITTEDNGLLEPALFSFFQAPGHVAAAHRNRFRPHLLRVIFRPVNVPECRVNPYNTYGLDCNQNRVSKYENANERNPNACNA
jgi:hypothetical protein